MTRRPERWPVPDGAREIERCDWPREAAFRLYQSYDCPYFAMTANVDVTELRRCLKSRQISFTVGLAYVLARAANGVPEMRQRIRGARIIEHAIVHPSITVLRADQTFSFCELPFQADLLLFRTQAESAMDYVKRHDAPCLEDRPERDDYLFLTGIPWVSFTAFQHPVSCSGDDAVPRIAWGKFFEQGGRLLLPVNIQVHHGLADGVHVGGFYEALEMLIADPEAWVDGSEAQLES